MKNIITLIVFVIVSFVYGQDNYKIKNLEVNTKYSDFGVSFYGDNVVYASSKKKANKSSIHWVNGQFHLDLYKGLIHKTGEIINSNILSEDLSTKFHESNAVFTKDLKTVYFTRNNYFKKRYRKDTLGQNRLKIFKADINKLGQFTNITSMPFNNDNYSVGHPALSPDETKLYFTSDMPGGIGGTDIYVSNIEPDGSYGTPMNLGNKVNTSGKEMFPYVSTKGNLYFSSDRKGGQGGLDIYVISLNNKTAPVSLESPINSPLDDFCFIIDEDKKNGYFSSNREGGYGDDDIYYFEMLKTVEVDCTQIISGTVRDESNGALLPEALVKLYKGSEKIESIIVGSNGKFSFSNMDCSTTYKVVCDKENYIGSEKTVTTTKETNLELKLGLMMTPKKKVLSVEELNRCQEGLNNINTIYFDSNKYYIRADAAIELDKIVKVMNKCQGIKVEVKSHTDSRGSDVYNMTLSQNRAKSTVDYIVSKGIDASRILPHGFGETQLLNRCSNGVKCSKKEHQLNRRIKFTIIR